MPSYRDRRSSDDSEDGARGQQPERGLVTEKGRGVRGDGTHKGDHSAAVEATYPLGPKERRDGLNR